VTRHAIHTQVKGLADVVLDTYVYNGHGTTGPLRTSRTPVTRHSPPLPADALWAGVPVITLPGQHMAARVASTLVTLHLSRAPDVIKSLFVVRNFEEYAFS
jgi:predicted O-linked N-acetylglucosamine transferase (SPINDLY family)